jgi:hypothetical protein
MKIVKMVKVLKSDSGLGSTEAGEVDTGCSQTPAQQHEGKSLPLSFFTCKMAWSVR